MSRITIRSVLIGMAIGGATWFAVEIAKPWFSNEMGRIRENQALTCREGFVKLERRLLRPVCVPGYEP